jgi:hypothetical protein
MSEQTNDPHDVRLKELFKNKEAFLSLLKDCVKADWVESLDADSLKRNPASYILQDFRQKEADIVYEATIDSGRRKVIFYVLLEIQSKPDHRMPYRLLLYIVEILRDYYNGSDPRARERKGFRFPAVVPVVFYSGGRKWTVPRSLRGMFDGHERFGDALLDFSYALVDAKGYDDESVRGFHSRLLKVMMAFEKAESVAELCEAIDRYGGDIDRLDDEELRIVSAALRILGGLYGEGESGRISETLQKASAERVGGMLSNLLANEKKALKLIYKQGR